MKTKTSIKKGEKLAFKHGGASNGKRERIYAVWCSMRFRCKDKREHIFKLYGAKGITVCVRWNDFSLFRKDMGEMPSPRHQIDRIDSDKGYFPRNCRWVTPQENVLNSSIPRWITYKGQKKTLTQWSKDLGINMRTLKSRIDTLGWSLEEAMGKP